MALPAALAFAILAVQAWIPWSVPHFETQDGSAYVYSAVVARDLVFNPHSVYAPIYEFQRSVVPNWGTTIVLNVILCFVGVDDAEKLLMSLYIVIGFFCFSYCVRSIAPAASPWTPIANFVLQNWLLWTGFYNFYLGTMLGVFVVGWYIRHASHMSARRAVALAIGLIVVFFTHLMAAALTALAVMVIALWIFLGRPMLLPSSPAAGSAQLHSGVRQTGLIVATLLPLVVLFVLFARSSPDTSWRPMTVAETWSESMHLFATAAGPWGDQIYLWPVIFAYIVVAIVVMQRAEWETTSGGLALTTIVSLLVFLILPDSGFGGGRAKIRFVWAIFIFGGILAVSVRRLQPFRVPFALYVAGLLIANLIATTHSLRAYSRAVEDYLSAVDEFPPGSRIVRLRYPTSDIPQRYGYDIRWDPLRHVDGYLAAGCRCIDFAEYQAPNHIFPIVFKASIDRNQQQGWWWNFEAPNRNTADFLDWLFSNSPGPPDYVIVVADHLSPQLPPDFPRVMAMLEDFGMQMTPKSRSGEFVRVYKRTEDH
jgi:hypothetical protein